MLLLGSHVGMSGKEMFLGSVKEALSYGANTFMIYTGAPQNTRRKELSELRIEEGWELLKQNDIHEFVVHAPYIINLANTVKPEIYSLAIEFLAKEKGSEYLHTCLSEVDPESANQIHHHNVKRVVRALEYYHTHGEKISVHNERERQKKSPYQFLYFVLTNDRKVLYDRIEKRIDQMISEGLVDEVDNLLKMGYNRELVSMQGLGYKEFVSYLMGECTLEDSIYILKRDTRHFAKRQLTWFRRERDVRWLDKSTVTSETEILDKILDTIRTEWSLYDEGNV